MPVYVGKGETAESIQTNTVENLEQIRRTAKEHTGHNKLHVTCLNTYSTLENQATMIDNLYQATRGQNKGDNISYMPTNPDGTFRALDISPELNMATPPRSTIPLQKKDRLDEVVKVVLSAANTKDMISVVQCASGQDRTGTVVEETIQTWMQERYQAQDLAHDNIETMRAKGGNAAEITAHFSPGSPGMKPESMANNFFGGATAFTEEASQQFYRSSANTNKKNPVGHVDFLKNPSEEAIAQCRKNIECFATSLKPSLESPLPDEFHKNGLALLENAREITNNNPSAQSIADLNLVIPHCTTLVKDNEPNSTEFKESINRLASASKKVSGHSSPAWKALGAGLLTFACLALVVVGVLAAIPTGGTSLLLTALGATGLVMGVTAGVGGAAVLGTAAMGAGALKIGREDGLANSVNKFKAALNTIKSEEKKEAPTASPGDSAPNTPKKSL